MSFAFLSLSCTLTIYEDVQKLQTSLEEEIQISNQELPSASPIVAKSPAYPDSPTMNKRMGDQPLTDPPKRAKTFYDGKVFCKPPCMLADRGCAQGPSLFERAEFEKLEDAKLCEACTNANLTWLWNEIIKTPDKMAENMYKSLKESRWKAAKRANHSLCLCEYGNFTSERWWTAFKDHICHFVVGPERCDFVEHKYQFSKKCQQQYDTLDISWRTKYGFDKDGRKFFPCARLRSQSNNIAWAKRLGDNPGCSVTYHRFGLCNSCLQMMKNQRSIFRDWNRFIDSDGHVKGDGDAL